MMTQETMQDVWKKFDEVDITHSGVHHLMAIYYLIRENGYARGIDVAKYLNITRGSVSVTMSKLKARGFITEDSNRFYRLTAEGLENVELVLNKRSIIRRFFTDVLGLTEDIATIDACKVEHLLSRRSMGKLLCFTDFYLSDNRDTKKFRNAYNKTCKGVRRI